MLTRNSFIDILHTDDGGTGSGGSDGGSKQDRSAPKGEPRDADTSGS